MQIEGLSGVVVAADAAAALNDLVGVRKEAGVRDREEEESERTRVNQQKVWAAIWIADRRTTIFAYVLIQPIMGHVLYCIGRF